MSIIHCSSGQLTCPQPAIVGIEPTSGVVGSTDTKGLEGIDDGLTTGTAAGLIVVGRGGGGDLAFLGIDGPFFFGVTAFSFFLLHLLTFSVSVSLSLSDSVDSDLS